ncbi:hypothetical protein [Pseudomonas sp. zfem002]|uniref:hypothetical protein n=1 Tax=Pseudomonas sp. zfem002 TaxID=3078197 RepID=UPI0029291514|nr:hypothetical protein [Pseudomonas sp. zfem002]MDU9391763.1 hypothetical protein [Pseudomonas sp. zfem002]
MSTSTFSPARAETTPAFFVVAVPKLIIMTLFTCGLYCLFWYLRNWELYRKATGEIMLLPRILWPEFFVYSLLNRVDRRIRASGRNYEWSPWWLACGILLTWGLGAHLWMVSLPIPEWIDALLMMIALFLLALGEVQRAINFCEGDPQGGGNAQFTVVNWLWISIVTLGWVAAS